MNRLTTWLVQRRGAATTEKLLVLLVAIVLIGGALMVFGPELMAKYQFAADALGAEQAPAHTLADGPVPEEGEGIAPIWYVVFMCLGTAFFLGLISPLLFPRARHTRQRLLGDLAERFPVLTPLVDRDMRAERGMGELRELAQEVNDLERHKSQALDIRPLDLAQRALPVDETVDADFSEMPEVDVPTAGPHMPRRTGGQGAASLQLGSHTDEDEPTHSVKPLSRRLAAVAGDDDIPFDAVSPSVKPQMAPLHPDDEGATVIKTDGATESTTLDVESPDDLEGDALAADILRRSRAFGALDEDPDATIVNDAGAIPSVGSADPEAPTRLRKALDPANVRDATSVDETAPAGVRDAGDPDATTRDYNSYDG